MQLSVHRLWIGNATPEHDWTHRAVASVHNSYPREWKVEDLHGIVPSDVLRDSDPRHVSNVARYYILWHYGGLWLDHDIVPLTNMQRPYAYTAGMGEVRVACAMNFPEPQHPMLAALIEECGKGILGAAPQRSGGKMLTRVGHHFPSVRIEQDVLPHDRDGNRRRDVGHPWAVHLWRSSFVASQESALVRQ